MASGLTRKEQIALIGVIGLILLGLAVHALRGRAADPVSVAAGKGRWEKLGEVSADGHTTLSDEAIAGENRTFMIDINHAGVAELDRLPGIGPAKAKAIIETRERVGGFRSVADLDAVKGIGPATLERMKPHLKFGATSSTLAQPEDPAIYQPAGLLESN